MATKNTRNALADPRGEMRATPRKNALMGYVADALTAASDYTQRPDDRAGFGDQYSNPPLAYGAQLLGLPAVANTAQRLSYSEPLTTGRGQTMQMRPDTVDAAMAVAPAVAKWPKQAAGVASMLAGGGFGADDAARAATVYHGTPHRFDAFDASKIGTGEGAQVYGHGIYVAENPSVARWYQKEYGGQDMFLDGKQVASKQNGPAYHSASTDAEKLAMHAMQRFGDADAASRALRSGKTYSNASSSMYGSSYSYPLGDNIKQAAANIIESGRLKGVPHGNFYEADLPDELISKMLDFDNKIDPEKYNLIKNAAKNEFGKFSSNGTGGDIIRRLTNLYRDAGNKYPEAAAAQLLKNNGIPGVRYLDGGSRGAGAGTSNYVVFPGEENAITILERNGKPVR